MSDETAGLPSPGPAPVDPAAGAPARRRSSPGRRWWIAGGVAVSLIGAAAIWVVSHPKVAPASNPYQLPTIPTGRLAPSFSLPRLGGGAPVMVNAPSAPDPGGRLPMVVNFFASWCPNCAAELSAFATESHAATGKVEFLGVDSNDSDHAAAESLLAHAGVRYPVGVDARATIATDYLVEGLPTTVFINRDGQVIGEAFGAQTVKTLRAWVSRLERPVT